MGSGSYFSGSIYLRRVAGRLLDTRTCPLRLLCQPERYQEKSPAFFLDGTLLREPMRWLDRLRRNRHGSAGAKRLWRKTAPPHWVRRGRRRLPPRQRTPSTNPAEPRLGRVRPSHCLSRTLDAREGARSLNFLARPSARAMAGSVYWERSHATKS